LGVIKREKFSEEDNEKLKEPFFGGRSEICLGLYGEE
jgi:hypothetical protein